MMLVTKVMFLGLFFADRMYVNDESFVLIVASNK